jgi:hypothetical protein
VGGWEGGEVGGGRGAYCSPGGGGAGMAWSGMGAKTELPKQYCNELNVIGGEGENEKKGERKNKPSIPPGRCAICFFGLILCFLFFILIRLDAFSLP